MRTDGEYEGENTVTIVDGCIAHIPQSLPQLRGTGRKCGRPRLTRGRAPLRGGITRKSTRNTKPQNISEYIHPLEHMSKRKWAMDDENVLINFWEGNYETYTKSKRESRFGRKMAEYLNLKQPPLDFTHGFTEEKVGNKL